MHIYMCLLYKLIYIYIYIYIYACLCGWDVLLNMSHAGKVTVVTLGSFHRVGNNDLKGERAAY